MKRYISMFLSGLLFFTGCAQTAPAQNEGEAVYRRLSAEEAMEMMETLEDYILLDVRTEEEYLEKRIENALLIPDNKIEQEAEEKLPDKNAIILVYCRSGRRSANAANALVKMGYTGVYDFGGINDWPYDTVSG
jgi:phage shock protein E